MHVGVDDVGIPHIDHPYVLRAEVEHVVLVVVGTGMAEGKQRRCLANPARAEACAGPPLGAHVVRRAENRNIRVDRIPIGTHRRFGEGAMAHERQVQASGLVAVVRHVQASPTLVIGEERSG
ncbi:hypothetical protein D9M68_841600 [compost metagenome]